MEAIQVSPQHVVQTIAYLQDAGRRGAECVVLWLAQEGQQGLEVRLVYRPDQVAAADMFRIPPASMKALMTTLSSQELMIAAQVHSHPHEAFHSHADDTWAIVRHVGALSLVLPYFALKTNAASFIDHMKAFRLTLQNRWLGIAAEEVEQWLCIR